MVARELIHFDGVLVDDAHRDSRARIRLALDAAAPTPSGREEVGPVWVASAWRTERGSLLFVLHNVETEQTLTAPTVDTLIERLRAHFG